MKQRVLFLLTALLASASMWAAVNDEFTVDELKYMVTSESPRTVAVIGYTVKPTGNLEIPSFVIYEDYDYSVTLIESYAFRDCSGLTSVAIGEDVKTINAKAFQGCSSMKIVNIGSNVTSIGKDAFYLCTSVTDVFCWANPETLSWNEDGCDDFIKSTKYATRCHVDNAAAWSGFTQVNVTFVTAKTSGDDADRFTFGNLEYQLKSTTAVRVYQYDTPRPKGDYEIPSSVAGFRVRGIGQDAFKGCTGLTTVTIPKSVRTIEKNAFAGCSNVTDVFCWADVADLTWEGGYSEFKPDRATRCHVLDSSTEDDLQKLYTANVTFENNLCPVGTEFWDGNFKYRVTSLTAMAAEVIGREDVVVVSRGDLVIPATANGYAVTSIGESAFFNCPMSSVTIPEGVTSIGEAAFSDCYLLTSVTFPEGVTSIGRSAFDQCYNLTSITLPGSVTSIGYNAFRGCINLCSITIPEGVKSIGVGTFYWCWSTDVYCYADPAELTWDVPGDEFQTDKATKCHVRADKLAAFNAKWNTGNEKTDINVTFVGDLDSPVMTDATSYNRQYDETVATATYQKTIEAEQVGKHQAWLLPFDYEIKAADLAKFSFYRINMIANSPAPGTEAGDDVWVFLTKLNEGDVLRANRPYVCKPLAAVTDYAFTAENITLKVPERECILECSTATDNYFFYATYEYTFALIDQLLGTVFEPFYYVDNNGGISYLDNDEVKVSSFRWIMRQTSKTGGTPSYATKMHFWDEDTMTGIEGLNGLTPDPSLSKRGEEGSVYNLAGQKIEGRTLSNGTLAKGIYIVNGKKVAIK